MKGMGILAVCTGLTLAVAGCGPGGQQYRATAVVVVASKGGSMREEAVRAEVKSIETLAASMLTDDGQNVSVSDIPKTHLIEISVTGPDRIEAAELCNRIAERYVLSGRESVIRRIVSRAAPPRERIR